MSSMQIVPALAAALLVVLGTPSELRAQATQTSPNQPRVQPTSSDGRDQDRAAVTSAMQALARAFESRDAKALAAHWTSEGKYQNQAGTTVRGREALESAFTAFFAKTPEVAAQVQSDGVLFLSRDTAIDEGSVTIRRGSAAEGDSHARYHALLVRENGKWLLAQLSESQRDEASLADLGWLVGEWRSTSGQGAEIRTTYTWSPSKKFIHVQFTIQEKERALTGTQVIGIDPATGGIRSWTFEASGGVGEADWTPDGDHWVLDAAGTLEDGRTLTETNILRRVNDNTFTWQSIERLLDEESLPDLAPVKVTRVKPTR